MIAECKIVLLVQAAFDGELDAAQAANLQVHHAQCPVCQAAGLELTRARELLRGMLYPPAPYAVRERVLARLGRLARPSFRRCLGFAQLPLLAPAGSILCRHG